MLHWLKRFCRGQHCRPTTPMGRASYDSFKGKAVTDRYKKPRLPLRFSCMRQLPVCHEHGTVVDHYAAFMRPLTYEGCHLQFTGLPDMSVTRKADWFPCTCIRSHDALCATVIVQRPHTVTATHTEHRRSMLEPIHAVQSTTGAPEAL